MREVILSKRASVKLEELLDYLEKKWSEKVKIEFIEKLDKSISQIRLYPESAEKSAIKKGLHRCVVTKQTTIYYRFDPKTIWIVAFFDTRMNPERLNKELE